MGVKAALSKPFAKFIAKGIKKWSSNPIRAQQKVFDNLIIKAKNTAFGKDHDFDKIISYIFLMKFSNSYFNNEIPAWISLHIIDFFQTLL